VDALDDKNAILALREQYPDAAFVSGLRGIGLDTLKRQLLEHIERDYVERMAFVPVTEAKTIAYIHRVTEVLDESYMPGVYPDQNGQEQPIVRLLFRVSNKHSQELSRMLTRFAPLRPVLERTSLASNA
jgi:GTP-binding protein HflX